MGIIFGSLIFVLAAVLAVLAVTGTQKSRSLQQEMKRMDRQISKMQKSSESLEKELEELKKEAEKQTLEEKAEQNGETTGDVQDAGSAGDGQDADTSTAQNTESKSNGRKVAVDPGHQGPGADTGGTEPLGPGSEEMKDKFASGTQGVYTGVPEYELTLNISMQLQAELKSRGYEVIMTREDNDTAVSNVERAQIAAENGAEILVRIHADGSEDNSANGAMTMIPSAENPYVGQLHQESSRLGEEIINAYKLLGSGEGIFCEPASAASVAGLLKRKDEVPAGATVVCVLTGNGLKDPDCAINNNDAAFHTDLNPDLETVAKVMGF